MTDEDLVDCIMDIDNTLSEAELALESKKYKLAMDKLKEARAAIEDLKEDDEAEDCSEVEVKLMNKLK